MERGWKTNTVEISPNCPRCGSSNTKFCYYNNYSSNQPRYFCKGCRRYWTKGGSLRNVPIGGGCRKSRRGKYNKTIRSQANNELDHSEDDLRRGSSSLVPDGPNIDLAQVYASFLNQKPDHVQTMFHNPSPEHSSLLNTTHDLGHGVVALSDELGLAECLHFHEQSTDSQHFGTEDNIQRYCCRLNSAQKKHDQECSCIIHNNNTTNFELPPLPGEEVATSHDDMLWSNPEIMMEDHALQAAQSPLFGAEVPDADFLMGNYWSQFELPKGASFSWP
ncbi:hypothetical protein RJT34_19529 [Clitoria ternatea]|uniref:Dof zinc finger protein n=1 Tax=Clitoria ternatea TaxID=43366 RepID=A0AAN9IRH1_CLITE